MECKTCFTENFLVFSLKDVKVPQETRHFLDREDDVLDYSKTVNFNRNAKRLEHAMGLYDQGSASAQNMPDEIDGDDRLGVSRRTGITLSNRLIASVGEPTYSMDESMFIESDAVEEDIEERKKKRLRRYSVIGNDPSFKQYTKNHDYDAIRYAEQRKEKSRLEENILTVTLKESTMIPTPNQEASNINGTNSDPEEEEDRPIREQYRVVKKDLLFKVNF